MIIVRVSYPGDNFESLKWAQHDVYYEALDDIVRGCVLTRLKSRQVLKDFGACDVTGEDGKILYDHLDLQALHDHIAAYWRWEMNFKDPQLEGDFLTRLTNQWRVWLQREVKDWIYKAPSLVTSVTATLRAQGIPAVSQICGKDAAYTASLLYPISDKGN